MIQKTIMQGQLVEIQGKNMHVKHMGRGEKTIVLVPGWDTSLSKYGPALPTADFAPLMRDLSQDNKVCIVEFFGYGLSDKINRPHTNENYVQEIREVLKLMGLKPPYILMPYSCSGVYCEHYAATYPSEIEALILLDTLPTVECFSEKLVVQEKILEKMSKQKHSKFTIGLGKCISKIILRVRGKNQKYIKEGYTKDEIMACVHCRRK
ncbi:MAG: alpha/beta hydrolase [Firmicutes bacterium]|nr:alpha/beta hydrolase [Bacillota bacterium]